MICTCSLVRIQGAFGLVNRVLFQFILTPSVYYMIPYNQSQRGTIYCTNMIVQLVDTLVVGQFSILSKEVGGVVLHRKPALPLRQNLCVILPLVLLCARETDAA